MHTQELQGVMSVQAKKIQIEREQNAETVSYFHDQKSDESYEDEQGHEKVNNAKLSQNGVATMAKREEVVIENENAREAISELERTPEIEKDNSQNLE